MMQFGHDGKNDYVEVGNVRVTKVPAVWGGKGGSGIRIQAKRGDGDALHRGAEIETETEDDAMELLAAVAWSLYGN